MPEIASPISNTNRDGTSRLAAQSQDNGAASRAGRVGRWRRAMADGLTGAQASASTQEDMLP
jgi:hypothetical protein